MELDARILVTGCDSLIGGALCAALADAGHDHVRGWDHRVGDPESMSSIDRELSEFRPDYVFVASGASGGIEHNRQEPATLMRDNLLSATQVLHGAHLHGVKKLLYLASSCCYPRDCAQPMRESDLFAGPVEPTSEAYATAKRAAHKLCLAYHSQYGASFLTAIAADAFGPGEVPDIEKAHVVPALLLRMHRARAAGDTRVVVWGSGRPTRDFVFAPDLARALIYVMRHRDDPLPINVTAGTRISIRELAETIRNVVNFDGELVYDTDKPDGAPMKALDASRLRAMGFDEYTPLREALARTYAWLKEHASDA